MTSFRGGKVQGMSLKRSLLSLLLCGIATAHAQTLPKTLEGVHRVVCLGDSITQFGDGPGGYVWLFRHYLNALYPAQNIEVINAGISGNKSTDMIARFQKDVLDKKPDLITISVGVNDVWHGFYDNHPMGDGPRGVPLDAYTKNVDDMVTRAQAKGAKVVVLSATVIYEDLGNRLNDKAKAYNAALRDIAKKHHTLFVDYQKPFRSLIETYRKTTGARDNLLTGDGVHMNAAGNKVMAYTLLQGLGIAPEDRAKVQDKVAKEAG